MKSIMCSGNSININLCCRNQTREPSSRKRSPENTVDSEAERKRQRLAKLAAWKQQKDDRGQKNSSQQQDSEPRPQSEAKQEAWWVWHTGLATRDFTAEDDP